MAATSAPQAEDLPGTRGVLRVFRHPADHHPAPVTPDPDDRKGFRRSWTFVPGPSYPGMEDNDLRGYLDGRFLCGWNQPGQTHVRVGRIGSEPGSSAPPGSVPRYGEHELFRTLQRWDLLRLPPAARVVACRLRLTVEEARPFPVRVVLYAVKKDWNPGRGGVEGNNVSIPKPGEVWWNEAAFGDRPWGLPGAGFAAGHAEADTTEMPLAEAVVRHEGQVLEFASPRLDDYARGRIAEGGPLLFLLKAADHQEDVVGTTVAFYSANFGDSRSLGRRPRLCLAWTDPGADLCYETEVVLERGRSWTSPPMPVIRGRSGYTVDFAAEKGGASPTLEVSWARGHEATGWCPARGLLAPEGDRLRVRVVAGEDPVSLGDAFTAEIRDTWVLTGPPEEQRVSWTFASPSGMVRSVNAEYVGDYTWRVRFVPEEPGTWSYRWRHRLAGEPVEGGPGRCLVVARDLEAVRSALRRLEADIAETDLDRASRRFDTFRGRFSRLQRAAVTLLGAEGYRSSGGREVRRELDGVRARLWGKPLPEEWPLRSMPLYREVAGRELEDPVPKAGHVEFRARWAPGPDPLSSTLLLRPARLARRLLLRAARLLARAARRGTQVTTEGDADVDRSRTDTDSSTSVAARSGR